MIGRIYTAALTLVIVSSVSASYASTKIGAERFAHIDRSVQFPETKTKNIRHTFQLHIPEGSSAISQVKIELPAGLTVTDDISIFDQNDRKVDAKVSVNSNQVVIAFSHPLTPETTINIVMNHVSILGVASAWLYPFVVKFDGNNADIPIGIARVRSY